MRRLFTSRREPSLKPGPSRLHICRFEQMEAKPGDAKKVFEALKKATLTISLGLRNDYLLLAVAPSTDILTRLGQGKALLGRPEFQPLVLVSVRDCVP